MSGTALSRKYQAYLEYKDSGVKWLGQVPSSWEVKRLGQYLFERREKCSDKEFAALSVTKHGIVPQLETAAKTDAGDNRKRVHKGDFVINSRSDRKGSSGLSELDGSVSLISIVLEPRLIDARFVHHLLRSYPFQEEFYRYGKGIVADLWSTNYSEMKNINLPIPELYEQRTIAAFLDYETARIDDLIAKQQRLIELLKEKRQAVISHAVTKGLNPDAPMKDSGVVWLGQVPEHWVVTSIKHLVSHPIIDGPHVTPVKQEKGVPFISAEALATGEVNFDKKWGYISTEDHQKYSKRYSPLRGDILMVKLGATTGVCGIVDTDEDFNIWVPLAVIRAKEGIVSKFMLYLLKSDSVKNDIQVSWTYGTQQTLGLGTIANMRVTMPPEHEQLAIVQYIDSNIPKYQEAISAAERSARLLQERRTALIASAVTGKIDLRGWQPPASDKQN